MVQRSRTEFGPGAIAPLATDRFIVSAVGPGLRHVYRSRYIPRVGRLEALIEGVYVAALRPQAFLADCDVAITGDVVARVALAEPASASCPQSVLGPSDSSRTSSA
jgi:hypothetical protein